MLSSSGLWSLCIAVLLLSQAAHGARSHPNRYRYSQNGGPELYNGYNAIQETILPGAGCTTRPPPEIKAPKKNVWADLTRIEKHQVGRWVKNRNEFKGYEIDYMQILTPNKTDILQYLDHDGEEPSRYANVVVYDSKSEQPQKEHLRVGPLPVTNATTWEPLSYPYTSKDGKIRCLAGATKWHDYDKFIANITDPVKDVTKDLWNLTADEWFPLSQDPLWQYDEKITEWSQFWAWGTGTSSTLLPLGLYFKCSFDLYKSDPSSWKFEGWLYNNKFYSTTEEFRNAYSSPRFEKLPPNIDGPWTRTDQKGPVLPLDTEAPPMPVAKSARFSVDHDRKYVQWMGFSFYMGFREDVGMSLWDIRFKGERILYELSMQEALAHYLDSAYSMGNLDELMPGFDCPTHASYLNLTVLGPWEEKVKNAICLFEYDADYSIQRHATESNTKNIYFVVRTITTVGNYDYSFSYEFYMDGSIQVVVRAAGYIEAAYYAHNSDYGYQIHDALSGAMHDHVLNCKADFDILDTANTMELVTVTPATENYVWSDQPRHTMKLVRSQIESEDDSRLHWSGNGATQYRIINTDKPNKYGEYRGYRILPSQGTIHLSASNSSNLANAVNWAYHDLQVTKQKDTEPRSSNPSNYNNVYDPLVGFDHFFDGESLQQEDLVVWFNLGMHHIPHTGDLPNTVFTTPHSAVQITPSNFFDRDESRDTVNMIKLDWKAGKGHVETFGQAQQVCVADVPHY
ncbi:uncharacterized protein LTR77_011116 [Saxophila tyrrhenica]|uniref:Amine oxidase n=1 Tax=Saxophila tyrrhenica TaxID=1690608 RepID=A0AAV9NX18_9PEZI|nr:hypothetical protein LTR77_011116 [Saxophila tyrrhenica]